ncbi:RNA polymerase sigma factor FliA [Streptomyces microflavus]
MERAYATLEARLRRTPSESEVAVEMGIAVEDLHAVFSQLSLANVVALEELLHAGSEGGDRLSLMDTLEDTAADNPVEVAEDRELRRLLARAINTLPEREKTVVTLYYYKGPHPRRDRERAGCDREQGQPDPHQVGAATARQAGGFRPLTWACGGETASPAAPSQDVRPGGRLPYGGPRP